MYKPIYENDGKDKAVSPIIATILIVAITVVLAATLYAVISGYGGIIGKSTPSAGVTVSTSGTTTTVTVNSVGGNLSLTDLKLQITASGTGTVYTSGVLSAGNNYANITGNGYKIVISGGGGYLTGLSILKITPVGTTAPGTASALKLVDTSTNGVVFSYPS